MDNREIPVGVSVVIPHYGDAAQTMQLVEATKRQQYDGSFEIIVVDDCSPIRFPPTENVVAVHRPVNGGFGSAVNSGAAVAKHPLMLVLNSDLEIGPRFIADLVAGATPWQPAVVAPQIVGHSGDSQWVGRHFPTIKHQTVEWLTLLARWRHLRPLHEAVGHDTRCVDGAVVPVDWVMGAAMLIPTPEFRAVGGFDERFYMNSEEVDLQRRLRERRIPSVFLGTVTAVHEGGGSSDAGRRRQWLVDSRIAYAHKWGHPRVLGASLRAASVLNLMVNVIRQAARRDIDATGTFRRELEFLRKAAQ